jgi:hypothetical protein
LLGTAIGCIIFKNIQKSTCNGIIIGWGKDILGEMLQGAGRKQANEPFKRFDFHSGTFDYSYWLLSGAQLACDNIP